MDALHITNAPHDTRTRHMLITGGGVSSDGQHWEAARGKFLVPVRRALAKDCRQVPRCLAEGESGTVRHHLGHRLATRVGLVLQALRPRQRGRAELSITVCLSDRDQQCTDTRHGRHPRDLPLEGPQQRYLADRADSRCPVPAAVLAARPAARFSPVSVLRTLALFPARLVKSSLAVVDPSETDGRRCADHDCPVAGRVASTW